MNDVTPTIGNPLKTHLLVPALTSSNVVQKLEIQLTPGEIRQLQFYLDNDETGHVCFFLAGANAQQPNATLLRGAGTCVGPGGSACYFLDEKISGGKWVLYFISRTTDEHSQMRIEALVSARHLAPNLRGEA